MVNRVQGRLSVALSGDLTQVPRSDDRPLYWTRVTMTRALNRWNPPWGLTTDQRAELQLQFERTSRGQLDINFLPGPQYKRLLLSSFDVFTLPAPGTNGTGMRNGNPSAATALSMDGNRTKLPDGTTLLVEVFVLPVSYPPFGLKDPSPTNPTNFAMQEETLDPYFRPGPLRVDASISMSQGGGDQFNLEQWNGRFHGPAAGNDGITLCPTANNARIPPNDDCDVYPPAKFLGYNPVPWQKEFPPQFTVSTLPIAAMINAATGAGVPRPPGDSFPPANLPPSYPDPTGAFGVQWHVNYTVFRDCSNPATVNVNVNTFQFPPPTPPTPPLADGLRAARRWRRLPLQRERLPQHAVARHLRTEDTRRAHPHAGDDALLGGRRSTDHRCDVRAVPQLHRATGAQSRLHGRQESGSTTADSKRATGS
jgi:hypothetical protein